MAAVDFNLCIGHAEPPQPVAWNRRDLILYALGIGAGPDDLAYVYEGTRNFRAVGTYPLVLGLKGDGNDTNVFSDMVGGRSATPGFPKLDPNTIVHGEQSIQVLAPIPPVAEPGWKLRKRIVGVRDAPEKGKGLVLETEVRLVSPTGHTHAIMIGSAFYRGGSQGTGFSKMIVEKPAAVKPPARKPDFELEEKTSPAQAALYRLSGDYNPLHIDESIGKRGGLPGAILHGLCSYGHAARAVLRSVNAQDGKADAPVTSLLSIAARFTSPVMPGDTLITQVWTDKQADGTVKIAFEQNVKGGKKSLGGGSALVRVETAPAKL